MVKLADIAEIKSGYPFRGAIVADTSADTHVVQLRDISHHGELNVKQLTPQLLIRPVYDWMEFNSLFKTLKHGNVRASG